MGTADTANSQQPNFRVKLNSGSVNILITHNHWLTPILLTSIDFIFWQSQTFQYHSALAHNLNHILSDIWVKTVSIKKCVCTLHPQFLFIYLTRKVPLRYNISFTRKSWSRWATKAKNVLKKHITKQTHHNHLPHHNAMPQGVTGNRRAFGKLVWKQSLSLQFIFGDANVLQLLCHVVLRWT